MCRVRRMKESITILPYQYLCQTAERNGAQCVWVCPCMKCSKRLPGRGGSCWFWVYWVLRSVWLWRRSLPRKAYVLPCKPVLDVRSCPTDEHSFLKSVQAHRI